MDHRKRQVIRMTKKDVEARMQAICDELGLSFTATDSDEGVGLALDREAVEALPADQQARLEDVRYELVAAINGTALTFTTEELQPGHARLHDENLLDGGEALMVNLTCPAEDWSQILKLASVGIALLPMVMQPETATEESARQVMAHVTSQIPTPEAFGIAQYKADEIGELTNRAWDRFSTEAMSSALDTVSTVEEMFGV